MTPDPVILVLEDERLQILTLRAQLSALGRLQEFTDPEQALEYARAVPCDVAVIDVRMPKRSMDGLGFLRALRSFDQELSVVIRTADDSERIVDGAIEYRAVKRAIKSKTSADELRRVTDQAVQETRRRRETAAAARTAEAIRSRLAQATGDYDVRLAAAALQRGLVQGLRKKLTSLSVLASLMRVEASRPEPGRLVEQADRTADIVRDMIDSVNAYLDGPFGQSSAAQTAAVNECLTALAQMFAAGDRATEVRLSIRKLRNDAYSACRPLDLANGLRHLVEFFLGNVAEGSEVSLTAELIVSPAALADRVQRSTMAWNRPAAQGKGLWVSLRVSGMVPRISVGQIHEAFSFDSVDGRTGNLRVLARLAESCGGAVLLHGQPPLITADFLIPAAD